MVYAVTVKIINLGIFMKCTSADALKLQNSNVVISTVTLKNYLKIYQNSRNFGFGDGTTAVTELRNLSESTQAITYGQVYAAIQSEIKQLDDEAVSSGTKTMINAIVSDFKQSQLALLNTADFSTVRRPDLSQSSKTVRRSDLPPNSATQPVSSSHTVRRTKGDQYLTKRELGLGLGISGEGVDGAVVASLITNIMFRSDPAKNTMNKLHELYTDTPAGGTVTFDQFNDAIRGTMCSQEDKPKVDGLKGLIKQYRSPVALEGMAPVKNPVKA